MQAGDGIGIQSRQLSICPGEGSQNPGTKNGPKNDLFFQSSPSVVSSSTDANVYLTLTFPSVPFSFPFLYNGNCSKIQIAYLSMRQFLWGNINLFHMPYITSEENGAYKLNDLSWFLSQNPSLKILIPVCSIVHWATILVRECFIGALSANKIYFPYFIIRSFNYFPRAFSFNCFSVSAVIFIAILSYFFHII